MDTDYNSGIIRASSPASSISSTHPTDQTSESDDEAVCSQLEFESKWEDKMGLGKKRAGEEQAERDPLLVRPTTPNGERALLDTVLGNLREAVSQLREEDIFERNALQGAHVDQQSSSSDVDAILRSMMPPKPKILTGLDGESDDATSASLSTVGGRKRT